MLNLSDALESHQFKDNGCGVENWHQPIAVLFDVVVFHHEESLLNSELVIGRVENIEYLYQMRESDNDMIP